MKKEHANGEKRQHEDTKRTTLCNHFWRKTDKREVIKKTQKNVSHNEKFLEQLKI